MLRPHQPPREALISCTAPLPAPTGSPFIGSWEWVLNWPEEAQRFLLQFAADGTLTLMSHRQHLPLGLGCWCALEEWGCQWEWYALVSSEDAPDTYGGEWHLWGDLHLSSRHYAGSRVADAEVLDAHGHVLLRQERLAITAHRLLFEHLQGHGEVATGQVSVADSREKGTSA